RLHLVGLLAGVGADVLLGAAAELGGRFVTRSTTPDTLAALAGLVAAGELDPQISARYPLARAAEALALVESGHARGKLVLEVA
ncbi:zinc-binding dehydrogenase, partial [Kitasatospora sp. NPDC001574]